MHLNKKITKRKKKGLDRVRLDQCLAPIQLVHIQPPTPRQAKKRKRKKEKKEKQGPYGHTDLTQPNPNKRVGHTGFALT